MGDRQSRYQLNLGSIPYYKFKQMLIFNFTEEIPEEYQVEVVESNSQLQGTLIGVRKRTLLKRWAGFNILKGENIRWFYKPFKHESKTIYEIKKRIESFDELLMSTLNILGVIEDRGEMKSIYKLIKNI